MPFHRDVAQRRGDVVPDRPRVHGDGLGAQAGGMDVEPIAEVIGEAGATGGELYPFGELGALLVQPAAVVSLALGRVVDALAIDGDPVHAEAV